MTQENQTKEFDVLIVGAGFAGIYQLLKLRRLGLSAVNKTPFLKRAFMKYAMGV